MALYGRAYPRDFVDVFFLLESGVDFGDMIRWGKIKDPGLIEFYLAGMMRQVERIEPVDLPTMLKPFAQAQMTAQFLTLANQIHAGATPYA